MGEKKFRADQLWEWLWLKSARSFDQMTNLSLDFRAKLASEFSFPVMTIANTQRSSDGTIKYAFRLDDGFLVEGVLIPTKDVAFCRRIKCKVNLIEYNPIDLAEFVSSSAEKIQRFADYLEKHKVIVNVRRSRGKDIDAACGQLANKLS